jgi:ABC-type branched-subunit amino acid transport system ATPase component
MEDNRMDIMRIQSIEVKNFKSLVDFKLDLTKFNCLIGLNGAGKSTVLQFIDFLSELVKGDMKSWLKERKWNRFDLKSKLIKKLNIDFSVQFSNGEGEPVGIWEAVYRPKYNRCTREHIKLPDAMLETSKDGVTITDIKKDEKKTHEIVFGYEGSILSALKEELLPSSLFDFKALLQEVKSLDLLDPEHLRQRTRESSGTIGLGGQNLSAFLHEMSDHNRHELFFTLKKAYPQLQGLSAKSLRSGWKQIEINETYKGIGPGFFPSLTTEARHINDGMLRLMAILAELQTKHRFVLFDEIENGINPELVEFIIDKLVNAKQQVLITTHSPMILNYLDDEVARTAVIYLYKTSNGHTKSIPFFSIPSMAEKLKVMGPGEVYADTNLTKLADEIDSSAKEEK